MLKGLKKKNNQAVLQQPNHNQPNQVPSKVTLHAKCQEILKIFTKGNYLQLKAQLQDLKGEQQKYYRSVAEYRQKKVTDPQKFAYQLDFNDGEESKKKKRKKMTVPKSQRKMAQCKLCPQENQDLFPISTSSLVLISLPETKIFPNFPHFIISPIEHQQSRPGIDEDIETQITNFQKCLIMYIEKEFNMHTIFIQQFKKKNEHLSIECIGVPLKKAYDLPMYFKQSLESQQNWRTHKSIIDIRKQKGGLRKQIPKQMNYFYIDFGIGFGYAHIIEDERCWDPKLGYQIVAGAVGGDILQVKTTLEYCKEQQEQKAEKFWTKWTAYDWTQYK